MQLPKESVSWEQLSCPKTKARSARLIAGLACEYTLEPNNLPDLARTEMYYRGDKGMPNKLVVQLGEHGTGQGQNSETRSIGKLVFYVCDYLCYVS
jgi:hypothetical protein